MLRYSKWIAPMAGLVLVLGFAQLQSRADDAPAATPKAKVTVTVVDGDGKPVEGAKVVLTAPRAHKQKGDAAAGAPAAPREKPTPVANGVTDSDGKAILSDVPDGRYRMLARVKGTGAGHEMVTVADGKDVSVSVTLKPRKAKAN